VTRNIDQDLNNPVFLRQISRLHSAGIILRWIRVLEPACQKGPFRGDYCVEPDGLITKRDILGVVSRLDGDGNRITFGIGPAKILIALSGE
jgi:hypothetical protein